MQRERLLKTIQTFEADQPLTAKLEHRLQIGAGFGSAWYSSQKEHWLRWLANYHTPGVYGRAPAADLPCQAIYNRLQCPPMVFWLGEAAGVPGARLHAAFLAAISASNQYGRQTAAIRHELPWQSIEAQFHLLPE